MICYSKYDVIQTHLTNNSHILNIKLDFCCCLFTKFGINFDNMMNQDFN